jgi:hypothetical protein
VNYVDGGGTNCLLSTEKTIFEIRWTNTTSRVYCQMEF